MNTTVAELSDTIWSLARSMEASNGLRAVGLTEFQIGQAAESVLAKPHEPRLPDRSGLHRVLTAAWRGMAPSASL
jgi:hypothetical protein